VKEEPPVFSMPRMNQPGMFESFNEEKVVKEEPPAFNVSRMTLPERVELLNSNVNDQQEQNYTGLEEVSQTNRLLVNYCSNKLLHKLNWSAMMETHWNSNTS
jgi:hypothetical protein